MSPPSSHRPVRVGVSVWLRTLETHLGPTPMYTIQTPYVSALRAEGAAPLLLIPVADVEHVLDSVDGVLLSGGNDLEPSTYGAQRHPRTQAADHERDAFEASLAAAAIAAGMPILAICRGMQSLNVALGGSLHQNVEEHVDRAGNHDRVDVPGDPVHTVVLEPRSRLAAILGTDVVSVNSMHHQAIADPAPGLCVVGRHPESGLVEAVELQTHPWCVAVQWHPEVMAGGAPGRLGLFRAFVDACRTFADSRPELGT